MNLAAPTPGSIEEERIFAELQANFPAMYREVFSDPQAPRTVVVLPSMTLEESELAKIPGVMHYEERMLCLLMLLRLPRTQLIYVTSLPLDPAVVDYYLHLLPGVPTMHARARLELFTVDDASLTPLSKKLLSDPDRIRRLREAIRHPESAHMSCFNTTELERTLAVTLGIPMYACDPALSHLGNKSTGREIFREVGLSVPPGREGLSSRGDIVDALLELTVDQPKVTKAVVKLNDGFSGEGNALVSLSPIREAVSPSDEALHQVTEKMRFEAPAETWELFEPKFESMGGIVEAFIDGEVKTSPSVQMRIDPLGELQLVSTHDQLLSGPSGQVFLGCTFPAVDDYRLDLHDAGYAVAGALRDRGVIGRFGVDFISLPSEKGWHHYAIEINLRKGGTTLPYLMLEFLTDGQYHPETGVFKTPTGDVRTYYATDNLVNDSYRGLEPADLIDIAVYEGLHYHATTQRGLVFHLLGSVTDHGKIGLVSIAPDLESAKTQYDDAVATLNRAAAAR